MGRATVLRKFLVFIPACVALFAGWSVVATALPTFAQILLPFGVLATALEWTGPELLPAAFVGAFTMCLMLRHSVSSAFLFAITQCIGLLMVNRFSFKKTDSPATPWLRGLVIVLPGVALYAASSAIFNDVLSADLLLHALLTGMLLTTVPLCVKLHRHVMALVKGIQAKNRELKAIARTLPDAIVIQSVDGTYLARVSEVNNELTSLMDSLPAQNMHFVADKAYVARRMEMLQAAELTGKVQVDVLVLQMPSQPARHVEVRVAPFSPGVCLSMVRDVTVAKLAESAMNEVKQKSSSLLAAIPNNTLVLNARGVVTQVISDQNSAAFIAPASILNRSFGDFLVESDKAAFFGAIHKTLGDNAISIIECRVFTGEEMRWVEIRMVPYGSEGILALVLDTHEKRLVDEEVAEKTELLNIVSNNINDVVLLSDDDGKILFATPSAEVILGYTSEELLHLSVQDLFSPVEFTELREKVRGILGSGTDDTAYVETAIKTKDGRRIWLGAEIKLLVRRNQQPYFLSVYRDITEQRTTETKLKVSDLMVQNIREALIISDMNDEIVGVNPAFLKLTGYTEAEVLGQTEAQLMGTAFNSPERVAERAISLAQQGSWKGEIFSNKKNGSVFPEWRSCSLIHDAAGRPAYVLSLISDLSVERERDELIWKLTNHDSTTGLPNLSLFADIVEHACARAARKDERVACFTLKLTKLRVMAENMGADQAKLLIGSVTQRLNNILLEFDGLGSLRDSEFAFIKENAGSRADVSALAEKLSSLFDTPFKLGSSDVFVRANIGIAVFPEDAPTPEKLLSFSVLAASSVSRNRAGTYHFYGTGSGKGAADELNLEQALHHAVRNDEIRLHYQPKIDVATGKVCGFEALSRWHSPELGEISPTKFIPVAEETGLILSIGNRTLRQAVSQLAKWRDEGFELVPIAVNLSLHQIKPYYLISKVAALLSEFDIPPRLLKLEITETAAMQDAAQTVSVLKQLRQLGVGLVLDDFGVGYSSLSHLRLFPLTGIKLDKSFVSDLGSPNGDAFCAATITLAKALNLQTTAEGVESEEQRELLKEMGCDTFQGFLVSPAVSAEVAQTMLSRSVDSVSV